MKPTPHPDTADTADTAGTKPFIDVAAGLILRPDGQLLLGQRPAGKPWEGWWELPGGKLEPGETALQALARELKEELDIDVTEATPWVTYVHEYPKTIVRLAFCRVTGWNGEPRGVENQQLAWVTPGHPLPVGPVLPATEPPLRWLQLPNQYLLSRVRESGGLQAWLPQLQNALAQGVKLVQFREPGWHDDEALDAFRKVLEACHAAGARCLLNSAHPASWLDLADGLHLRSNDAHSNSAADDAKAMRAAGKLLGVSAHNAADLARTAALGADFAVLGHVLETPSHPGEPGLGWPAFERLNREAGLPVFAIGGQSAATLKTAMQHGAHGVAGMRQLGA